MSELKLLLILVFWSSLVTSEPKLDSIEILFRFKREFFNKLEKSVVDAEFSGLKVKREADDDGIEYSTATEGDLADPFVEDDTSTIKTTDQPVLKNNPTTKLTTKQIVKAGATTKPGTTTKPRTTTKPGTTKNLGTTKPTTSRPKVANGQTTTINKAGSIHFPPNGK